VGTIDEWMGEGALEFLENDYFRMKLQKCKNYKEIYYTAIKLLQKQQRSIWIPPF